ncbi:MAG: hypothetical protein LBS79_04780 [Tannerella sp.]|jgi:hypothetical protein|nr:hypothetical protein [Tannerella sp.]
MKKILTLLLTLITTGGIAQVEIRHGLLLGGGRGFVSGAATNINPEFWDGMATVSEIFTKYRYNALLGYRLRIIPPNGKAFYDIDASVSFKNIEYSIWPERIILPEEPSVLFFPMGGKRNFFMSLSLIYNRLIYKGLYVGAGIAPVYCDDRDPSVPNHFDVPLVVKAGYDLRFIDLSFSHGFGTVSLLKDRYLTSGRINDWQIQLFIPF